MKSIHDEMDGIYGKRRMLVELVKKGFKLGLDKARRLMKKLGLVAKRPKQHVILEVVNHQYLPPTI